jgi:hypothetical protein
MLIHCPMGEEERQQDSDLRQSRTTAKISATETLEQQEKIRIPPSVSRPVKRKRVDVGGKMYEDELMVLNVRLKGMVMSQQLLFCGISKMEYFLKIISSLKVLSAWAKINQILEPYR